MSAYRKILIVCFALFLSSCAATPILTGKGDMSREIKQKAPIVGSRVDISPDGRFIAYDNGTVLDTSTNLMWAAKDNGADITWQSAKSYCENYRGGGYSDWRMPTRDELVRLYDRDKSYKATQRDYNVNLTNLIQISTCCSWASDLVNSYYNQFSFLYGKSISGWKAQSEAIGGRALPVRFAKDVPSNNREKDYAENLAIPPKTSYIEALGIGAPSERAIGTKDARPQCEKASFVAALSNLLRIVKELRIEGTENVGNIMINNDIINKKIKALIRGAEVTNKKYFSDGTCETSVRISYNNLLEIINDHK